MDCLQGRACHSKGSTTAQRYTLAECAVQTRRGRPRLARPRFQEARLRKNPSCQTERRREVLCEYKRNERTVSWMRRTLSSSLENLGRALCIISAILD